MESQYNDELQRQIDDIFQKSITRHRYSLGISQILHLLEKAKEEKPSSKTLYQLGFLFDHVALRRKNAKERHVYETKALSYYRHALKLDPRDPFAVWGIGRVWWHREDKRSLLYAKKAYSLAKTQRCDFGPFAQNIGVIYEELLRRYTLAEKWYLRALKEEQRKTAWSYVNLIQLYTKLGKLKQAKKLAEKASILLKKTPLELQKSLSGKWLAEIIFEAKKGR